MSSFVNIIQDRDGTDYYLKATIPSVESTAESVAATDPVSVDVDVDSDGVVSFDFHIPAASTANADAAAQEARDAADACEAATSAANTAATGATTAAQNAVNATVDTVHATQDARTAITDTQAATASANTAASAANTAKDATIAATTAANSATTAATTATSNANTATTNATTATASAITAAGAANTAATDAAQAVADLQAFVPLDADNILKASETGAIVSTDDAYPSPLLGLVAYGNSVQNGTPTPETPVPIKSVAGAAACTSGKNLAKLKTKASSTNKGITSVVDANGLITESGTSTGNGDATLSFIAPILFRAGVTYAFSFEGTVSVSTTGSNYYGVYIYNSATKDYTSPISFSVGSKTSTWTPSVDIMSTHLILRFNIGMTVDMSAYLQIEEASSPTAYEPSVASSTPLTLIDDQGVAHELRSVPNGTRDELVINADGSGTLTVKVGVTSALSTYTWTYLPTPNMFVTRIPGLRSSGKGSSACTIYQPVPGTALWNNVPDKSVWSATYYSYPDNMFIKDTDYGTDANAFKASLGDAVATYLRATPITYHIPAINMPSLPALVSNAWLSCTDADGAAIAADINITYRRDINAVIDRIDQRIADTQGTIAPVEGSTASANYAVGSYLVHDDVLYKITSAIANGETIIPGTNVTATTVMAELAAING